MENNNFTPTPNRLFKDRLFKMIFHEKNELLQLYNAINGTHYSDPDLLEINTLENAIYDARGKRPFNHVSLLMSG